MNASLSTEYVIEAEGLSRAFDRTQALRDFTLRVPRGGIYGFLGRNGAGKTTAIKILAGLIRPNAGTVRVLGLDPSALTPENRQRIGYVSEKQILPTFIKVHKLIQFCSQFYPDWNQAIVDKLIASFRIDPNKKISALSNGAQRQVAFILALAQRPELLILDEPASTLDVVARREFLDEILNLIRESEAKTTVFLSTHILSDIERVADHIGILVDGTLKISEPLDELKETVKQVRFHSFTNGPREITLPETYYCQKNSTEVFLTARIREESVVAEAARHAGAQYEIYNLSLEEIFIKLARN